jgi:hypothetical protein
MSAASGTTARGPHSAERFSGLETDEMKRIGSSLLFPSDSVFEFELTAFRNATAFENANAGSTVFPGKEGFLLTFRAYSKFSKTLQAPCAVGGLCKLTEACLKKYTEIHLPAKEQRKLGLKAPVLKWPGVDAFLTCPKCSIKSKVGGSYFLIFYSMLQLHATADPFVAASRVAARLMCINCMFDICQGNKIPKNLERAGLEPDLTVFTCLGGPGIPVFVQGGGTLLGNNEDLVTAWRLYWSVLKLSYYSSMEDILGPEILQAGASLYKEILAVHGRGMNAEQTPKEQKKRVKDMTKAGICFVCKKENSERLCSRCKKVSYCGTGCQRKDWNRHKIAECIPQDGTEGNRLFG